MQGNHKSLICRFLLREAGVLEPIGHRRKEVFELMIDYLYDGTFEGLLTCVYYNYYEEKAAGIFKKESYQSTLLSGFKIIATEEEKATKVYDAIERKISRDDLRRIYRVFLSNIENKETVILKYVQLGFKEGSNVSSFHSNPIVFNVQQIEKKVSFEVHRLAGLVRFTILKINHDKFAEEEFHQEILYSCIEPDHDVLELMAGHFADRFKNEPFIIHDKARGKAVFAQGGIWYISDFNNTDLLVQVKDEKLYQELWKEYFTSIAIKERINPRCQKRFMPIRYWKNLTEFQ